MRLFIAIDLPGEVREALARLIAELQAELRGMKWVRAEGIHLTLRFLGEVEPSLAGPLADSLHRRVPGHYAPLRLGVGGAGLFPDRGRPRVLWLGVQAAGPLAELRDAIEQGCVEAGFPPEEKAFRPHLTLARCGDGPPPAGLKAAVTRLANLALGEFDVNAVVLFESQLRPDGARYRRLAEVPL